MKTIPFKIDHLDLISIKEAELPYFDQAHFTTMTEVGVFFSLVQDGRIVAIAGHYWLWPGVIEVSVLPSIYVKQYAKSFWKRIKVGLDTLANSLPIHRIQTFSLANSETDSWMQHLGFTCEGTLVEFSKTKQDFRIWARMVNNVNA